MRLVDDMFMMSTNSVHSSRPRDPVVMTILLIPCVPLGNNMLEMKAESGFFYPVAETVKDWTDFTLILPWVAVGNVAQLAVDVLISTLKTDGDCDLAGRIHSDSLVPVVGPNAFELSSQMMTTCEVYESVKNKLVVIQIRAPCFKEKKRVFVGEIVNWIRDNGFKMTLILSSSFSQFLASTLSEGERFPVRFLSTSSVDKTVISTLTDTLGFKKVEKVERFKLTPNEKGIIHLPGSGTSKSLYKSCEANGIKAILLVEYCSEGDNTQDAFSLLDKLSQIEKIRSSNKAPWKVPISWRNMFGGDAPLEIF